VQRTPGDDAADSWQAIITTRHSSDKQQEKLERAAIDRLISTPSGAQLINGLWKIFCGEEGACCSRIVLEFLQTMPREHRDALGYFEPDTPDKPVYSVYVKALPALPAEIPGAVTIGGGEWAEGSPVSFRVYHTDSESSLAANMYHEILHVWFIHANRWATYPTGHQDIMKGEIEPVFLERIRQFSKDLDELEARLKREAQERRRQEQLERQRRPTEQRMAPAAEPETRTGRRTGLPVSGAISLRGGPSTAGSLGAGGSTILGADLILGKIVSLRLGARGVYMTPDHLFTGGSIGMRVLQPESSSMSFAGRVENPLFFDIEAGILAEVLPSDAGRLSEDLVGFGSLGIGQEFGRRGARFFWRVGGFVIVSDTLTVAGGGTAGAGIRF
jgi:hypothetical protein